MKEKTANRKLRQRIAEGIESMPGGRERKFEKCLGEDGNEFVLHVSPFVAAEKSAFREIRPTERRKDGKRDVTLAISRR